MEIIVDECLPKRFCSDLVGHNAILVQQAGFSGLKDNALLMVIEEKFDVFITVDSHLISEQNISKFDLQIIVLKVRTNRYEDVAPHKSKVLEWLKTSTPGQMLILDYPS